MAEQRGKSAQTLRQTVEIVEQALSAEPLAFGHGTEDPWDEAAWLVLAAIGDNPVAPERNPDGILSAAEVVAVESLLTRRIKARQPLAYLTGRTWFAGHEFLVDERALVPRSPIAELIEVRFAPWLRDRPIQRILDIGTGGGCIAIACAHAFPEARIDGTDPNPEALALATENRQMHGLDTRVGLYQADVFDGVPGVRYDLIVSNPPYVDAERMAELPAEYRTEPTDALAAGADGLDVVNRILAEAHEYLQPDGLLVVEVGGAAQALEQAWPRTPFIWLDFAYGGEGVFALPAHNLPGASPSA